MDVIETIIPLEKFNSAPQQERDLYIGVGHIANEFAILSRMLIICTNSQKKENPYSYYHLTQSLFFIKISCGKLFEANQMIHKMYYGAKISLEYDKILSAESKECLKDINKYLSSKDNIITKIRNEFAFHYDLSGISSPLENYNEGGCPIFMAEISGNSLFYISEFAIYMKIISSNSPDYIGCIIEETVNLMAKFNKFVDEYTEKFLIRYVGNHEINRHSQIVEVNACADLEDIRLPAIVSIAKWVSSQN